MNEQITLQDLRKRKYTTIKAFAEAYGRSYSMACNLLNGRYHFTLSRQDAQQLADLLGIPLKECIDAANATFRLNFPEHLQGYWDLETRWTREEHIQEEVHRWAKGERTRPIIFTPALECFTLLGIATTTSEAEIQRAFRQKVKASADGKGGYTCDMDKLVQAKERALDYVRGIG